MEMYEITIKEYTLQGTELITLQAKDDDWTEDNKMFDLKIVSVTPEPQDLEFYLKQIHGSQTGTISFKGCLDHEKTEKYTIIVEAKDHGQPENLSSSCTVIINVEDGNNHLPVITGQTGPGKVKEGQENVLVSRFQVTDKDTKGTAAWRAKYQIQGDTIENFRITTHPETNEGLLYVEKPLNYEDSPQKNVTVVVENDIPYYSCEVVSRSTTSLWKVVTFSASTGGSSGTGETRSLSIYHMTVTVEDVNEAPVFNKRNKQVTLVENVAVGQYMETFTARDPDVKSANTCVYMKGEDPADWVTVDPVTGKITTSKILDRESAFVKDNIYKVTVYAVDNGKPQMTGTATLSIFIGDENDNVPSLNVSTIDMCQSSGPSLAKITAIDLDGDPYGGPFQFKLIGDVEGLWKVDPDLGYSVNLVKENTVHSGHYELFLKVSDRQGKTAVHNLSVTVCNCLDTTRPNCRFRKVTGSIVGGGALGIISVSMLMFAGILLLAFLVSCTEEKETFPMPDDCTEQHLMTCNTELPGTDCKVVYKLNEEYNNVGGKHTTKIHQVSTKSSINKTESGTMNHSANFLIEQEQGKNLQWIDQMNSGMKEGRMWMADSANGASQARSKASLFRSNSLTTEQKFTRSSNMYRSMGASSTTTMRQHGNSTGRTWMGQSNNSEYQRSDVIQLELLLKFLNKMLYTLQTPGVELGDYAPHVYAEEGDTETNFELDDISIPDIPFDPDLDLDLDAKFTTLATICMANDTTAYSEKNFYVMKKH
ncbi:cadherin-2-like [Scomber scombrus]